MRKVITVILLVLTLGCTKSYSTDDYIKQGFSYISANQYEEAIIAFTNAIEIESNNTNAHHGRAIAFLKVEKLEEAFSDYALIRDQIDVESRKEITDLFEEKLSIVYSNPSEIEEWYNSHPGIKMRRNCRNNY